MTRIESNRAGICPHCLVAVRFESVLLNLNGNYVGEYDKFKLTAPSQRPKDAEEFYLIASACPNCSGITIILIPSHSFGNTQYGNEYPIWPISSSRPVSDLVPENIKKDFVESALILNLSPKASAALSRRCLQNLLKDHAGANQNNLSAQIDFVIPNLPSFLADKIEHIRVVGNFAAHPIKSKTTSEIIEVEPGEAEWNLDVLEMLFDFYFISPNKAREKKDALNQKLESAGKSTLE
jgi:hypothetical protein